MPETPKRGTKDRKQRNESRRRIQNAECGTRNEETEAEDQCIRTLRFGFHSLVPHSAYRIPRLCREVDRPVNHPDWPAFWRRSSPIRIDLTGLSPRIFWRRTAIPTGPRSSASRCAGPPGGNRTGQEPGGRSLAEKERLILGPLSMNRPLWAAAECPELVRWKPRGGGRDPLEAMAVEGADRLTWRRGFVESVLCRALEWSQHRLAAVRRRNPIRDVILSDTQRSSREQWYAGFRA